MEDLSFFEAVSMSDRPGPDDDKKLPAHADRKKIKIILMIFFMI